MIEKEIELYVTTDGKCPFIDWINDLSPAYKIRINKRINRLREGNFGDWKKFQNSRLSHIF